MSTSERENSSVLCVNSMSAGYGRLLVIRGCSLRVERSEIVALIGANGAGKTTLLRAISALLPNATGTIEFLGEEVSRLGSRDRVQRGLSQVIEGHRVFTRLSVADNLKLAAYGLACRGSLQLATAYDAFPILHDKRNLKAGTLSGGQKQMLTIAQGILRQPKLLMLDEPSAGLAPVLVDQIFESLRQLKENGTSVLLVEQLVEKALAVSDRTYVMKHGEIVRQARSTDLVGDESLASSFLA